MNVEQLYQIKVMSNKKQLGNKFFTDKKYEEAIAAYKEYVSTEHPDNKNTYVNIALAYSKMSKFQESIQYARNAIQIDPQYFKAYYRLFTGYKELPNQDYNVFINAVNFCKFYTDADQRTKEETEKNIITDYKRKIMHPTDIKQTIDPQFLQILKEQIKNPGLQDKWTSTKLEQDRWKEILTFMVEKDYEYGLNQAYHYINYFPDAEKKDQLRLQLQYAKRNYQYRMLSQNEAQPENSIDEQLSNRMEQISVQREPEPMKEERQQLQQQNSQKQDEKVEASDSNLFSDGEEEKIQKKNEVSINKINSQQSKPLPQKLQPQKSTISVASEQKVSENKEEIKNLEEQAQIQSQKKEIDEEISEQRLKLYYSSHFMPNQKTKDVFQIFASGVIKVLRQQNTIQFKDKMLNYVKDNFKKFPLYVKSLSQIEQKTVFELLKQHKLDNFIQDYAPKYKSV